MVLEIDSKGKPGNRSRRFAKCSLLLVLPLIVACLSLVKFQIGPHLLRQGFIDEMADYWGGTVSIGSCEYSFLAPQRIWRGVVLLDDTGRRWLEIDTLELRHADSTSGWSAIVDGVRLSIYAGSEVPVLRPQHQTVTRDDFCPVDLHNISVDILATQDAQASLASPASPASLLDTETSVMTEISALPVPVATLAGWGASLDWPQWSDNPFLTATSGDGKSALMAVYLSDLGKLFVPAGRIASLPLDIMGRQVELSDLRVGNIDVHNDVFELGVCDFNLLGGVCRLRGSGELPLRNFEFEARLQGCDLKAIGLLLSDKWSATGRCDYVNIALSHLAQSGGATTGKLSAAVSDIDSVAIELNKLLTLTQLRTPKGGNRYMVTAELEMEYPRVEVLSGRLTGGPLSVAVQSGHFDLKTHDIDAYLIMGMLEKEGSGVMQSVKTPIANLTRVRVKGSWDSPLGDIIGKQPLEDMAGVGADLFRGVINAGAGTVGAVGRAAGGAASGIKNIVLPPAPPATPATPPATPTTPDPPATTPPAPPATPATPATPAPPASQPSASSPAPQRQCRLRTTESKAASVIGPVVFSPLSIS